VTSSETDGLEYELRDLLAGVELVCEADISADQVDAAERVVREGLRGQPASAVARTLPASLVTYFVLRGSEVYTRNSFWEPLGITSRTSEAGQAFLTSLGRLGLPTFTEQIENAGARRFVAPILIHGALPATVATRLVECVENELRRGLVDAGEARRRLLRQPDIEFVLHRPAVRLLDWCPVYAERLLDAVIDYIESPTGDDLRRLPRHLQGALRRDTQRRIGLKRLRTPHVEFLFWAGIGPEVVGAEGASWVLQDRDASRRLGHDERYDIQPASDIRVTGASREIRLWQPTEFAFFDSRGRPIDAEQPIPQFCTALLPRDWGVFDPDDRRIEEREEGEQLSGSWSRHRSCGIFIGDLAEISVGPTADSSIRIKRLTVQLRSEPAFLGEVCPEAVGPKESLVYRVVPRVHLPGRTSSSVRVRFHPRNGPSRFGSAALVEGRPGLYSIESVIAQAPETGVLEIVESGQLLDLTFVPELLVSECDALLGPGEASRIVVSAKPGVLIHDGIIQVPAAALDVRLAITGFPERTITVPVPRVRWSLRAAGEARVSFADGLIQTDVDALTDLDVRLFVRCGRPVEVGLRVRVDGEDAQTISPRATSSTGPVEHYRSIALAELRDTIRAHRSAHVELNLNISGREFPAIVCGHGAIKEAQRTWGMRRPQSTPAPNNDVFRGIDWIRKATTEPTPMNADRQLLASLRQADGADSVVTFLRNLHFRQLAWKGDEFPSGPSGRDWESLEGVAHALWGLTGVRHREFTGDQRERLRRWAGTRRERWRQAPEKDRRAVEEWMIRVVPRRDQLRQWRHVDLLDDTLPYRKNVSSEWLPGTVLFNVFALIGGDLEASIAVSEAVTMAPELTLEAVAFAMQFLHNGLRILAPEPAAEHEDDHSEFDDGLEVASNVERATIDSLDNCAVTATIAGIELVTGFDCDPPVLRLSRNGRPVALLASTGGPSRFTVSVPTSIHGEVGLQLVDPRAVTSNSVPEVVIDIPATKPRKERSTTLRDLDSLAEGRFDALVDQIAADAALSIVSSGRVDALFDDEQVAALALIRMTRRGHSRAAVQRTALAVLPAAFLFSDIRVPDLSALANSNRLLFAALAPHSPASWAAIGWPNAKTFFSPRSWTELAGFAARLARGDAPTDLVTFHYASASVYPNPDRLKHTIERLRANRVSPCFVDLMIATHRALTIDHLTTEATRMLLDAHQKSPQFTSNAAIAGVASVLAGSHA
jgi:hypothetical protein